MAPRSIWKGTVGFGLVSVPVKLYGATDAKSIAFKQLHKGCNARIMQTKKCTACGEEVSEKLGNQLKGYEVTKDEYIIMEESDIQKIPLKTLTGVEILAFVDAGQVDPRQLEKSYFLAPNDVGVKSFALLLLAMEKVGKVGIVKLTMKEKEHLAMLRPFGKVILLQTLFYANELRPVSEVEVALPDVSDKEMAMGVMLLQTLEVERYDLTQFSDGYKDALMEVIRSKVEGITYEVTKEEVAPPTDDLVAALMASLKDKVPVEAGAAG